MTLEGDSKWLRPLAKFETFMEMAHQRGVMLTSYCLTLNSVKPLEESNVKKALIHLARKVPTLRLSIRPRNGEELWFYEVDPEIVDFQVRQFEKLEEEYIGMTKHQYNSHEGPLWCARLISVPDTVPCPIDELETQFPHQYKLIFGFHHAITDGTCTMSICGFFTDLLNDVIEGNEIDDAHQLAYLESGTQHERLFTEAAMLFMSNPAELEKYQISTQYPGIEVLILKAYPPPSDAVLQTLNLTYELGKEETSNFLKKCKAEGVSFHSGFCTALNAAVIEMIRNKGFLQDEYKISSSHVSNTRRYWNGDVSKAFGSFIGRFGMLSEVSKDIIRDFWTHARKFHSDLQIIHRDIVPYKESCALFMSMPEGVDMKDLKDFKMPLTYYTTTNMGNLAQFISEEGKHVQLTSIKRTTSTEDGTIWSHVIQTFRGRFLYSLDYNTTMVSKEIAQLYLDTIFAVLRTVVKDT